MTDFEVAIRGAFKLFWPAITLLGCYFHFSQLIWKRVKKTHLQVEYEKNYEFNALIRRLSSLPFVKPEDRVIHYLAIWIQKQGQSMRKKLLFIGFGSSVLHFVFPHLEFMHFYFLVLMLNLKQEKLKRIQGNYLKISIPSLSVVGNNVVE